MTFRVTFAEGLCISLRRRLKNSAPLEDGGFLLGKWDNQILHIVKEVEPHSYPWEWQEERALKPTTAFLNQTAAEAERDDLIPAFLHTHPMGWAGFSAVDERAHAGWRPFFGESNSLEGFASILWGMPQWKASIWLSGERRDTTEVACDD